MDVGEIKGKSRKKKKKPGRCFAMKRQEGVGRGSTSKDTSLSNISTATKAPYSRNPRPSRITHCLFSIFRFCFEPRLYRVFPHFQGLYQYILWAELLGIFLMMDQF